MDLQDMRFALCIARNQNLTKAARELYVSQPTLSKCLQKLEEEANGKLFTRVENRYYPTYLGEQYLNYARSVLSLEQQWKQTAAKVNALQEGELNVALPLMRSYCTIPAVFSSFHKKYPNMILNAYEESTGIQEKLLLDAKIDFAIFTELHPNPRLQYESLKKEEVVLILPPDHPLKTTGVYKEGLSYPWINLNLLGNEPFILFFPEQSTGAISLDLFRKYHISPPIAFRTRSSMTALSLSQNGFGACIIPETYVNAIKTTAFNKTPNCFSIGEKGVFSTLYVAYRKDDILSDCARDFIDLVKKYG